jgi:hypothetical protein
MAWKLDLTQFKAPAIILFIVCLVAILKLNYDYFRIEEDDYKTQIPYMVLIAIKGLIFIYVCHCLSKGGCNILSWIVAIIISLYIIIFVAVFSRIPMSKIEKLNECHDQCAESILFK